MFSKQTSCSSVLLSVLLLQAFSTMTITLTSCSTLITDIGLVVISGRWCEKKVYNWNMLRFIKNTLCNAFQLRGINGRTGATIFDVNTTHPSMSSPLVARTTEANRDVFIARVVRASHTDEVRTRLDFCNRVLVPRVHVHVLYTTIHVRTCTCNPFKTCLLLGARKT